MLPFNHFAHMKHETHHDEITLFECQPHKNYKIYVLLIFVAWAVSGFFIINSIDYFSESSADDNMLITISFAMIFIYVTYEYVTETLKLSTCRYRLTNHSCYIDSKNLLHLRKALPYRNIESAELLKRPWQEWFGLMTIRLTEKELVPSQNWNRENFIRLVSKADAEKILTILSGHVKVLAPETT
jgi:membrane protein YdbS with pleckstrin-like domain